MSHDSLAALRDALRSFAAERDWDQFHTPKNLAMALSGEAGELIAHFQWLTAEQSAALDGAAHGEVALAGLDEVAQQGGLAGARAPGHEDVPLPRRDGLGDGALLLGEGRGVEEGHNPQG